LGIAAVIELRRDAQGAAAVKSSGNRLALADGLRGVAALWVVLFHASAGGHLDLLKASLPDWLFSWVFGHGSLGVPIFFVLSGFVMALTVHQMPIDAAQGLKFVARRLVRLSPPMYFSFVVLFCLGAIKGVVMHTGIELPRWQTLLAHATYTQGLTGAPALNPIYWTLGVEVQFYLAFALAIVVADRWGGAAGFQRRRLGVFFAAGLISLAWPFNVSTTAPWAGSFLPFWYAFVGGVFAYWASREVRFSRELLWMFFAALGSALVLHRSYFTGAVLVTAVLLAQSHRWASLNWLCNWRALQFLGAISYSLYLLHAPIIGATFNICNRLLPRSSWGEFAGLLLAVVICIFASYLTYRFVEKPSIRWSRMVAARAPMAWPPK
jgi:peptidoglycan/LPS O-acetylase OafA/YrhL